MADLQSAANYHLLELGTPEHQINSLYWAAHCESPFGQGMADWDIDNKNPNKEVGSTIHFNKALGLSTTPGSGHINGNADVGRLRYRRDSFTRCQRMTLTVKIDNSEHRHWMAEGFDIKRDANEGVRRWVDQQVIPFQMAKLFASADKCNVIGTLQAPIVINSEYTQYAAPAVAGAIRPSHTYTRLLKKLNGSYGLCAANQYKMIGDSEYGLALANEGSLINTHIACDNGSMQMMCEMKSHGIQLKSTNWDKPVGYTAAGQPIYLVAVYDPRRVAAPMDLLEMEWHPHEGYKNLFLDGTFGFGVQDPKAIAVAYVTYTA